MELTTKQCREILGTSKEEMTDAEIEEVKNAFIVFSDLAIDSYLARKAEK